MSKTIYAVLIGINSYPYPPLYGCVNDVIAVNSFFEKLKSSNTDIADFKPRFYLAPNASTDKVSLVEAKILDWQRPTRDNLIAAFQHFEQADPAKGDICLLYYSGHGCYQKAPDEFLGAGDVPQVQTLVCVGEQPHDEPQELIGKELAYLIWQIMQNKTPKDGQNIANLDKLGTEGGVHFLSLMDCCHSGENTRGEEDGEITTRRYPVRNKQRPLKDYYGYSNDDGFYAKSADGKIKIPHARHVQMAASHETEKAQERPIGGQTHGIFTHCLLETLQHGGSEMTYKELVNRVSTDVQALNEKQWPNLSARSENGENDENLRFLGSGFKSPEPTFLVYFDGIPKEWRLKAGVVNNIIAPSAATGETVVRLHDGNNDSPVREAKVRSVGAVESVLAPSVFSEKDKENKALRASILRMAAPKISLFIAQELRKELPQTLDEYMYLAETTDKAAADYVVKKRGDAFVLTKNGDDVPLFKRETNAAVFLTNANSVGKWSSVMQMKNLKSSIDRDDITIEVEIIEGEEISPENIDNIDGFVGNKLPDNPTVIPLNYKNGYRPALRLKVKSKQKYYASLLYLSNNFRVELNFNQKMLDMGGEGEYLKLLYDETDYKTYPVTVDEFYGKVGIDQITDYIKIFVSSKPFDLSNFVQDALYFDSAYLGERGIAFDREGGFGNEKPATSLNSFNNWLCITIPVKTTRPLENKTVSLNSGEPVELVGGAILTTPNGFSGTVVMSSINELKKDEGVRGVDSGVSWGGWPVSNDVLTLSTRSTASEDKLTALSFTNVEGIEHLSAENPMTIQLPSPLEPNEVVVTYSYDETNGLYLPLGFSQADGKTILIENTPPQYNDGKSFGAAFVLLLKKVFIKPFVEDKELNVLGLCQKRDGKGVTQQIPKDEEPLNNPEVQNIVLLIHGIIGDTIGMVSAFYDRMDPETEEELDKQFYNKFDAVLTFDYESLNTPIDKTAENLQKQLRDAGLFKIKGQRLTIVAHSMGGLVSRWFIEQLDGAAVVKRLIQAGTPNGGSETADFRKSAFHSLTLVLNGALKIKPGVSFIVSFLGKRAEKAVFKTLNQMSPTASEDDFLPRLNKTQSKPNGVEYKIIGGDVQPIIENADTVAGYIKVLKYLIANYAIFKNQPHNDVAVTHKSMKTVPDFDIADFNLVASDHLHYFETPKSLNILEKLL